MTLYKQVASMPNTLRVPIRIWIRSFLRNDDPLYCGERLWFAGYHLELGGQKWMDFVRLETYEQALAVAKDLQSHQWFPDMTRYRL